VTNRWKLSWDMNWLVHKKCPNCEWNSSIAVEHQSVDDKDWDAQTHEIKHKCQSCDAEWIVGYKFDHWRLSQKS
jgi:hypothetical protein